MTVLRFRHIALLWILLFVATNATAATKFLEPGTDATQDFSFYTTTTGTVASATDQVHTGPRSIKLSTGAGPTAANVAKDAILADSGSRLSVWLRFDTAPAATVSIIGFRTFGGAANVLLIQLQTTRILKFLWVGSTMANPAGTTVLATNTWYRISVAYYITSTVVFGGKVFLNGVQEISDSPESGTLTRTGTNNLLLNTGTPWGANINAWYDDVYVDNSASSISLTDTGNISVTAKRPFANGTTNGFLTQIGAGGSGYGSGHAPQVNEQPLSTTNGWSTALASTTEEYNVEGATVGDVNINTCTIVDYAGWLYTKTSVNETAQIILNNVASNIAITTSNGLFTAFAGSSTYPAGSGTDIGEITSGATNTVSLYEVGIVLAYNPCTPPAGGTKRLLVLGVGN